MYDEAVEFKLDQFKLISESGCQEERLACVENALGECYQRKGDHTKALECYYSALEKLKRINKKKSLAELYDA
jgi:tetratricopeptide (TPR) repeat protein